MEFFKKIKARFRMFYFSVNKDFSKEKYGDEFKYPLFLFLQYLGGFSLLDEIFKNVIDHAKRGWFLVLAIDLKRDWLIFFISRSADKLKDNTFSIKRNVKNYKIGLPMIADSLKFWGVKSICFNWNYVGYLKLDKRGMSAKKAF
ncbi:MAG: hypothetical protein PHT40_04220 [Patescibacteria group bacterium]|nr:hypothetical protein [Patescibacteria group bacterium]